MDKDVEETRPAKAGGPSKGSKNSIDMLNGPLLGKMLLFALPLALSSILQQLLNSVDTAVAGRFVSSQSLAGIGGVAPITGMFINLFVGISIGANVLIAMHIGQGDRERISKDVHTTIILALVCGVALVAVGVATAPAFLAAISMPDDSFADALTYLDVYFCCMPFFMLYNFGSAVLRGKGDTRRPLYALAAGVVLNAVLDPLFACVLGWGTFGIALATDLANVLSALIVVRFLLREDEPFRLKLTRADLRITKSALVTILKIGVPAGVQGAVFSVSNLVIQSGINSFGSAAIAGSAAELNFEFYTYFFTSAFAQTAVTFIGQNYAARKTDRADRVWRLAIVLSLVTTALLSVAFTALGRGGIGLFTSDADAIEYGMVRLWHVELLEFVPTLFEVPAGAMRGMGHSTLPAVISIFGTVVLRVWYYFRVFPHIGTFAGLMDVYIVTWLATMVIMWVAFVIVRRKAFAKAA